MIVDAIRVIHACMYIPLTDGEFALMVAVCVNVIVAIEVLVLWVLCV